ncbi:aminotransferase class IV [Candidatus Peregrinibacteria bacterium]|nr:aminotransferase class IV [Candidatus Peregrinibacteria bacterium]
MASSVKILSINGVIVPEKEAMVPVTSEAFLYGFAVFETIRTYNGKVFRLDDHLARLYMSAELIGFKPKWPFKKTYEAVCKTLKKSKWPEAKIRVILTNEHVIVYVKKLLEKKAVMYEKGVKLFSYEGKRNLPHAKKLADAFCYVAKHQAVLKGGYDALLVDPKGFVRECAYANIFWVKRGKLYSTNKDILFGLTRETVVELAGKLKIKCKFEGVQYKNILKANEVFITQTTSGILPVVSVDGRKIGIGRPGPITKKLMAAFRGLVWVK